MSKDANNQAPVTPAMHELQIVSEIQGILGNATIKVHECKKAEVLMDWLEERVLAAQAVVDAEAKAAEEAAENAKPKLVAVEAPQAEAPASA